MNSLVSVDKNEQRSRFSVLGDREEGEDESQNGGNTQASSRGGSVVLLLPKENVVRNVESSDDCIPIMVDNVPVYLSQSSSGSPLYIRQYPPSVEDLLLKTPTKSSPSFDGFSEASGSTFDGFSEASYCSSVTFEGFLDENQENKDAADKVNVLLPVSSLKEVSAEVLPNTIPSTTGDGSDVGKTEVSLPIDNSNSDEGKQLCLASDNSITKRPSDELLESAVPLPGKIKVTCFDDSEIIGSDLERPSRKVKKTVAPLTVKEKTRSSSCDSIMLSSDLELASKELVEKKLSPSSEKVTRRSSSCDSKAKVTGGFSVSPVTLKRQNSTEIIASSKKIKPEATQESICKTGNSETQDILHMELKEKKADNVTSVRTRRSVVRNESRSSSDQVYSRKTRGRWRMTEEKDIPIEEVIVDDSQDFIGDLCSSVGCTISFLESMKIKHVNVCNGIVFELSEFAKRIAWDRIDVAMWIQRLSGVKDGKPTSEDLDKIRTVLKRRKALRVTLAGQKIGNMKLKAFDSTEFVLPSSIKKEVEELLQPICDLQEKDCENQKNLRSKKKMELVKEDVNKQQYVTRNGQGSGKDVRYCGNKVIQHENMFEKRSENKEQYRKSELEDNEPKENEIEEVSRKTKDLKKVKGKKFRYEKESSSRKTGHDCGHRGLSEDNMFKSGFTNSIDDDFDNVKQVGDECPQEYVMNKQVKDIKCVQSFVNKEKDLKESLIKTEGIQNPHIVPDSNVGTLGVSKSGRLRKPSARGIQSIEIKSLFMQNNTHCSQTTKSGTSQESAVEKQNSYSSLDVHDEDFDYVHKIKRGSQIPKDPRKLCKGAYINRYKKLLQNDNSVVSFTFKDGHLIPKFKEIDYYLGDYCCEAGVTVEDINSEDKKDVDMTVGMVKELHDFYVSRGASKTSLALRLLQMSSVELVDYTQLLSTVLSINKAAKTDRLDFNLLQREFKFPRRHSFGTSDTKQKSELKDNERHMIQNSYLSVVSEKRRALLPVPKPLENATFADMKKGYGRPRRAITQTHDRSHETDYDLSLDVEIVRARLKISSRNTSNKKRKMHHSRKNLKRIQGGNLAKGVNLTLDNEIVRTRMKEHFEKVGIVKGRVGRPRKNFVQKSVSSRTEELNSVHDNGMAVIKEKDGSFERMRYLNAVKELGDAGDKKRRVGRPRKKIVQAPASSYTEDMNIALDNDIVRTRGKEGSVTRGDIVYLYTEWLRNKMAVGSNVFVTDLLKDVEQLMAERKVQPIRIPAGTLMSSSVRLHDEYKQMLIVSKEDAMLYLEEDWLEDIQYLVSISGPSRRSTIEGDNVSNSIEKTDADESSTHPEVMSDSDYSEKSLVIDDCVKSEDSSIEGDKDRVRNKLSLKLDKSKCNVTFSDKRFCVDERASHPVRGSKMKVSREAFGNDRKMLKNHMESVGKRTSKRRLSIKHSLEEYDLEEFSEVQVEEHSQDQKEKLVATSSGNTSLGVQRKEDKICIEEDYDVEKIVDYQEVYDENRGKHLKYLVRWLGFGAEEDSWVNEADLQCPELLNEFWKIARRKGGYPGKQKPSSNNLYGVSVQNHEPPEMENFQTKGSTHCALGGSDKENGGNIIEALTQHTSLENYGSPKSSKEAEIFVTRRELLDLYDNWRQENQNVLMAGGSNTVNLEILVSRAKELMAARKIKQFHPHSLLNACFMMTLMKARLKTEKALNIFLDSNCSEVLEASHKQYLMMQHKYSVGEMHCSKKYTSEGLTISGLQDDLQSLQCDLSAAMGFRSTNRCVLGALEEEVDCLENIYMASQESNSNIGILLQQELELLKEDLNSLQDKNKTLNSMASNAKKSGRARKGPRLKSPISLTECGSDKLREPVLQAGQELLRYGVPSQKIDSMIELVVNKISGQRLRARPAGVRSIAEEVGLVHI